MKKIVLLSFSLAIAIGLKAQFSESFFNGLNKTMNLSNPVDRVDGIRIPGGFLGTYMVDSAGTNIQFVQMEYNGRFYNTYSSTLPAPFSEATSMVIDTYQSGNNTYLVVSDVTNQKVAVVHFVDYVYTDYAEVSTSLVKANFTSRYNSTSNTIAAYVVTQSNELKRFLFDLNSMSYSGELFIEGGFVPTQDFKYLITTRIRYFYNSLGSNEILYYTKHGKLHQAFIANNALQSIDTTIFCDQVYGIYSENNISFIVLRTNFSTVHKYVIMNDAIIATSSLDYVVYPYLSFTNRSFYARYNGNDCWFILPNVTPIFYVKTINDSGVLIDSSAIRNGSSSVSKYTSNNGKILCVGTNRRSYNPRDSANSHVPMFMSWEEPEKLFDFKEESAQYKMGRFAPYLGYGTSVFAEILKGAPALEIDSFHRATIFYAGYLIAGKDTSGNIRGNRFKVFEGSSRPGPYTNTLDYSQEDLHKYYESFYVDIYMIGEHLQQIMNQNPNYIPSKAILNWPANGDVSRGQAAQLAPYMDLNSNGVYEPMLGDYPDFPGTRCILTISHDPIENTDTTLNTGLELYSYLYDFDCEDPALKNTLFTKLVVKNRGGITYDSLLIGMMNDMDLGCPWDDYVGFNVGLGLTYTYNGDDYDANCAISIGFDSIISAQGYTVLTSSALESDGIDNAVGVGVNQSVNGCGFGDGIIDNEYYGNESNCPFFNGGVGGAVPGFNDDPYSASSNFLYMTNRWKDSSHFMYGYMYGGGTIPCKYILTGTSDPLHYGTYGVDPGNPTDWSEITLNNPTGDRRSISAGGSYRLLPDSTIVFNGAYVLGDGGALVQDGINNMFANTQLIRQYFQNNQTPCGQTFGNNGNILPFLSIIEEAKDDLTLYPNPTNGIIKVKGLKGDETISVVDYSGRILMEIKNSTKIDLSAFSTGIYIIQITNEMQTKSFKVVKN